MSYSEEKEKIRNEAIEWQMSFEDINYSWGEVIEAQGYFRKKGKRYGLLREFHENAIC